MARLKSLPNPCDPDLNHIVMGANEPRPDRLPDDVFLLRIQLYRHDAWEPRCLNLFYAGFLSRSATTRAAPRRWAWITPLLLIRFDLP